MEELWQPDGRRHHTSGGGGTGCLNETFTNYSGSITDNSGPSSYFNNMTCSKLIQPVDGEPITLTFTAFNTEAGYDYVRVYNGSTTSSPLFGTFSGSSLPPALTANGGSMLITFITNGGVVGAGWSAYYTSGGTFNPPGMLYARAGNTQCDLYWDVPVTGTPSGYRIYRSLTENGTYTAIDYVISTSTVVTGLTNG